MTMICLYAKVVENRASNELQKYGEVFTVAARQDKALTFIMETPSKLGRNRSTG